MTRRIRTTISLPADLAERAAAVVRLGLADSRGSLVEEALRRELRRLESARVDAAFYELAGDDSIAEQEAQVAAEFEVADADAFRDGEAEYIAQP
jgi:hypothetical protein